MIRLSSLVIISLLTIMSCKVVDDNSGGSSGSYATYRIAPNEIQGWTEAAVEDGGWVPFSKSTMSKLVDGECEVFTPNGMIEGAQQILINSSNEKLDAWFLDFSSKSTAQQMFQKLEADKGATAKAVEGFDKSVAILVQTGEGCTVYANMNTFILRLSFENFSDITESNIYASQFLLVYEQR